MRRRHVASVALIAALLLLVLLMLWLGSPPAGESDGETGGSGPSRPLELPPRSSPTTGTGEGISPADSSATHGNKDAKAGESNPGGQAESVAADAVPGSSGKGATPTPDDPALPPGIPVPESLRLTVLDAATGEPVVGARVLTEFLFPGNPNSEGSFGGASDESGVAAFRPLALWRESRGGPLDPAADQILREKARLRVRVLVAGYRTLDTPVLAEEQEIRMFRDLAPLRPARIEGRLRRIDGTPGTGRLRFEVSYSDKGIFEGIWTVADAGGAFSLEGLEPGTCRIGLYGSGTKREFVLVDGETAVWDLVSDEIGKEELSDVRSDVTRPVVVTVGTVDPNAGATVQAQARDRHSFRAAVHDGKASFPTLPIGTYRFVLVAPGGKNRAVTVDVAAGEEVLDVTIPPTSPTSSPPAPPR